MAIQKNIDETADHSRTWGDYSFYLALIFTLTGGHSEKLGSLVTLEYRVIAASVLLLSPLPLEATQYP